MPPLALAALRERDRACRDARESILPRFRSSKLLRDCLNSPLRPKFPRLPYACPTAPPRSATNGTLSRGRQRKGEQRGNRDEHHVNPEQIFVLALSIGARRLVRAWHDALLASALRE